MEEIILEIAKTDTRATHDSEICTWRDLLKDMEESGTTDITINSHELVRPSAVQSSDGA